MIKSLTQFIDASTVKIIEDVKDWQEAIHESADLLLEKGVITNEYVRAIFESHQKLGPYYVLGPKIAMPHARPEEGAIRLGLSLVVIKKGVNFNSKHNDPVHLVVMLSATDATTHLELLQKLAELFSDENDVASIINSESIDEILTIIEKY